MTNEEIIKTTATAFFNDTSPNTPLPDGIGMLIFDVLKVKDWQFKEYLEKKLESIRNCYQESKTEYKKDYYSTQMVVTAEIINELFGE